MTVLNERLSLASALLPDKESELDALADSIRDSINPSAGRVRHTGIGEEIPVPDVRRRTAEGRHRKSHRQQPAASSFPVLYM
mgnify:CR=1 FL=1